MPPAPSIVCFGAMLWDVIGRSAGHLDHGADSPGRILQRPGGVALNIALALARRGLSPAMLGAVGKDPAGDALIAFVSSSGVDCRFLHQSRAIATDLYMAIEDDSGLVAAIADATTLESAGEESLTPLRDGRLGSPERPYTGTLVLDSNPLPEVIARLALDPCCAAARLCLVPASPAKATRLAPLLGRAGATFYLNRAEAAAISGVEAPDAITAAESVLACGAHHVIVTDGPQPLAEARLGLPTISLTPPAVAVRHVTGAGDSFLAAHLGATLAGQPRDKALATALAAATAHISGKDLP